MKQIELARLFLKKAGQDEALRAHIEAKIGTLE